MWKFTFYKFVDKYTLKSIKLSTLFKNILQLLIKYEINYKLHKY